MDTIYVACEVCRKSAASGTYVTHSQARALYSQGDALAPGLQVQGTWNDATRGAYRAKRRENET